LRGAEGDAAIHLCLTSNAHTTQGQHPEMDCRVATLLAMTKQISDAAIHLAKVCSLSFAASMRDPVVYIMASKLRGTLYTGVTSNLPRRAYEHREGLTPGFTKQYGCKTLVWYEPQSTMPDAIRREKQIKAGSRADKIRLIEAMNPDWRDLFEDLA
jgi:predicted GIY-YIG superfamily endonuclease